MSEFVVDASVGVKWFFSEVHEAPARRLLDAGHDLLVPDVFFAEIGNALWKRVRRNDTTPAAAAAVLEGMAAIELQVYPSRPLLPLALDLATRFDRSVYDSLYLTVAFLRHCPVVTADGALYRALEPGPLRSHVMWIGNMS